MYQLRIELDFSGSPRRVWRDGETCEGASSWREALPTDLAADHALVAAVAEALEGAPRAWSQQVSVEGRLRTFALSVSETDEGALLCASDITEAVEHALEGRRSEWIRMLGQFAHQFRNPLAGITGALQVFGMELNPDDERSDVMAMVLEEGFRLNRLVGDLVTIARGTEPHLEDLSAREVVDDVASAVRASHPSLTIRVLGDATWRSDRAQLHRVALELIENAVEAAGPSGEVTVDIADERVRFRDSGPGIDPASLDRIFEPMFSTKERGMGLGLAVARSHARSLGLTLNYDADARAFVLRHA